MSLEQDERYHTIWKLPELFLATYRCPNIFETNMNTRNIINYLPLRKNDFEIIENYARELENAILKPPELWLWSHRRWKLSS